jgi:hypothetical protein
MSYSGRPFFRIPRPLLLEGGVESKTISAPLVVLDKDSLFQVIDGGGTDRDVTLPAEKSGRVYMFANVGSSHNLNLKKSDGTTPVGSIAHGVSKWVVCDGTNWFIL